MRAAHVAFFGTPHAPHYIPTLSILTSLARRGYRVTYITSDRIASRAFDTGTDIFRCKSFNHAPLDRKGVFDSHPRLRVLNMDGVCSLALRVLSEVAPVLERDKPDLIIYDLVQFAGRILAERWSIPAVQIGPVYAFDAANIERQVEDPDFREWVLAQGAKADRFLEGQGIHGDPYLFRREGLSIYLFPKLFQPPGTSLTDKRCLYAGRCAAEQPVHGRWHRTQVDRRPIALVSTSTTYNCGDNYFRTCIAALHGLAWHVVLSIGENVDPRSLDPLPAHFEVVQGTSHAHILAHASLFVSMGGNISASEAAFHGVPTIATTFGYAEPEWCAETNIVKPGLGIHIKQHDLSIERLRQAAMHVSTDPQIQDALRKASRSVQREPGGEEVVNRIDEYLDSRRGR